MGNVARPTIWFRYVDDTFTLVNNKDTAVQFLSYLNSRHKNIQFTMEFDQDQEIPFLDVLIKRHLNNSFTTSIYRKKRSLVSTLNGILSHHGNTRLTLSAHLLIIVWEFVHHPVCYNLLYMISRGICHAMGTPVVLFLIT